MVCCVWLPVASNPRLSFNIVLFVVVASVAVVVRGMCLLFVCIYVLCVCVCGRVRILECRSKFISIQECVCFSFYNPRLPFNIKLIVVVGVGGGGGGVAVVVRGLCVLRVCLCGLCVCLCVRFLILECPSNVAFHSGGCLLGVVVCCCCRCWYLSFVFCCGRVHSLLCAVARSL